MGFGEAIGAFYRGYFNFETRSSRSEFWWSKLYKGIIYVAMIVGMGVMAGAVGGAETDVGEIVIGFGMLLMGLFYLIHLIPSIAIVVRRFHDQNQSGWMFLLRFIPFYIGLIIIHIFMCIDGTHGENRFGEDPLGDSLFDTFS